MHEFSTVLLHSPSDDDDDVDDVAPPLAMRATARVGMAKESGDDASLFPPVPLIDRVLVDVDTVEVKPVNGRPPDDDKENDDDDDGKGVAAADGSRDDEEDGNDDRNDEPNMVSLPVYHYVRRSLTLIRRLLATQRSTPKPTTIYYGKLS